MYHIELMLTKKCNQVCYYCTTHSGGGSSEVDIDYLNFVLERMPDELGVELTGGEIGLIKNIDEVYQVVRSHKKVRFIRALSNGLLRINNCDWLNEVDYWEHLIYEIKGKEIIKFYNNLDLEQDHKYIIIATESTTRSLLANWEYFKNLGLFRPNFDYKVMNHKAQTDIKNYAYELIKLYEKLDNVYFKRMLTHYFTPSYLKKEKELCQRYSPNTYIDFDTKQIGHCAMNVKMSNKVDFNRPNLMKMIHGTFSENNYCQKCYSFDNGKGRTMWNNRSYIQQ